MSSIVTTLVTFASGSDALDHRAEHLAAELDELLDAGFAHVGDAFAPADHAGDLLDQEVADGVGIAFRLRRDVGEERHARIADDDIAQRIAHRLGGGLHQRAVERRGDGQRHRALGAHFLGDLDRAVDRALVARQHDLARVIVVGDRADFALGCGFGDAAGEREVGAEQRRHRALRRPAPPACIACPRSLSSFAVVGRSNDPAAESAEYSPRLWPATKLRGLRQIDAAFLGQRAKHRERSSP